MSMLLMVRAMDLKVGNPLRKLVLIKLADNANDNGECFPSHNTIAKACEISRSSVQSHIEALVKMGIIKKINRKKNEKENTSNLYILSIPVNGIGIPSDNTPMLANGTPIPTDGIGGIPTDEQEPVSIEPITEPVTEPKKINKKDSFDPVSVKPENLSIETWTNWIEYKANNKQKLQPQSWAAQSKMLEQQPNPEEIINLSIMNGWQGLFPDRVGNKTPGKIQPAKPFATQNYGETKQPDWARG